MSGTIITFTDTQRNAAEALGDGYAAGLGNRGLGPAGDAVPDAIRGALISPAGRGTAFVAPREAIARATLRIAVPGGTITSDQLHAVANLARRLGEGEAGVTPMADLALRGVLPRDVAYVLEALAAAGLAARQRVADGGTSAVPLRRASVRHGHVGLFPQPKRRRVDIGVAVPVGRLTAHQMDGLAIIAATHGRGALCLTMRQNLILPDLPTDRLAAAIGRIRAMGLDFRPGAAAAGMVAFAPAAGGRAASDIRVHALALCRHLDRAVALDRTVGIALGGGGEIALRENVAADGSVEGYDVALGADPCAARTILSAVPVVDLPGALSRLLNAYLQRRGAGEGFTAFTRRHDDSALRAILVGAA